MSTKELIALVSGVLGVLILLLTSFYLVKKQELECISIIKDKPAAEIKVICGRQ